MRKSTYFIILLISLCLTTFNCSIQDEHTHIPIPEELEKSDPLIFELITDTASQVNKDPNNPDLWARHASALLANSFIEESVESSRQALLIDSSNRLPLRYRQATALWRLNQQQEAMAELVGVLNDQPLYDCGWRKLASWRLELGDLDGADEAIEKALKLKPDRPGSLATSVKIHLQRGDALKALALLEPRLNQLETPGYLYFLASQAQRRLGNFEHMKELEVKSKPLPLLWPDPWMNQIVFLSTGKRSLAKNSMDMLRLNGPKAALPLLERAHNADLSNFQIRSAYAMSLHKLGHEVKAIQVLDSIQDNESPTFEYWITYGNIALEKAKSKDSSYWLDKTNLCFLKAESLSSADPNLFKSMARLSIARDEIDLAEDYFVKSASLFLERELLEEAKAILSEALVKCGETERLIDMYKSTQN